MAKNSKPKISLYCDTRRTQKDGMSYIKIRIYKQGSTKFIYTGESCAPAQWIYGDVSNSEYLKAVEKGEVRYVSSKRSGSGRMNKKIDHLINLVKETVKKHEDYFRGCTLDQVRDLLRARIENPNEAIVIADVADQPVVTQKISSTLREGFAKKMELLKAGQNTGNYKVYKYALAIFSDFLEFMGKNDIKIVKIDKEFLEKFEAYCRSSERGTSRKGRAKEGVKSNSISVHLRCLRHIIRRTMKDKKELMNADLYPFEDYKIPSNATAKRAIDPSVLDLIRALKLKTGQPIWHHRNYFLFLFNAQGMNLIDLAYLKRKQIRNNRLEYARIKTRGKAVFDIELTEEALEILEMYDYKSIDPEELVFPFLQDVYGNHPPDFVYNRYVSRRRNHNKYLKRLAKLVNLDVKLTSYVARHTWASVGFEAFENIDVIGQGLGHSSDPKVTKVYAKDLGRKRMDEVNRKITQRGRKIDSEE